MSIVGEAIGVIELITNGLMKLRERRDPARGQAQRFINAFEAYGISRQQISRVLPGELPVPQAAFSRADLLKPELTPSLLDWACNYLGLSRSWIDGQERRPHQYVDGHKDEQVYERWLRQRLEAEPSVHRRLFVWAASIPRRGWSNGPGYLSLAYVEDRPGLDGTELGRYWLLSNEWPLSHAPCVESMLKVVKIVRELDVMVVGRLLNDRVIRELEHGRIFAPQAAARAAGLWYPEDLVAQPHV